ncbi:biogenesis of lysosome-related organelles complex 1 subunit 4 isoform X2 [Orussus abietinus]|uniref:biogenesis of lysosome-related organelles complex 1 subunit 4 isoform X2 n=1 Tax=Orussus abietinus TaxID=222816 RepID=UPI000625F70D|nr:biogenesis of lysosome-related organelles complex 1 subunit 4 isoform X2 [Orussus abietinus]
MHMQPHVPLFTLSLPLHGQVPPILNSCTVPSLLDVANFPFARDVRLNSKDLFTLQFSSWVFSSGKIENAHETIEDTLMRLEEFESIIGMVQTEGAQCMSENIPRIESVRSELGTMWMRVDALQKVIARVNTELTAMETAVDNAEAALGVSDRIFGMINPLSFFKTPEPAVPARSTKFEPPTIYKTEEYFESE